MGRSQATWGCALQAAGAQALRGLGEPELKERRRRRGSIQDLRRRVAQGDGGSQPTAACTPLELGDDEALLLLQGDEEQSGCGAASGTARGVARWAATRLAHMMCNGAAGLQALACTLSRVIPKPPGRQLEDSSLTSLFAVDLTMVFAVFVPLAIFAIAYALASWSDVGGEKCVDEGGEGGSKLLWALRLVAVAYAVSVLDGALEPQSPLRSALISGM